MIPEMRKLIVLFLVVCVVVLQCSVVSAMIEVFEGNRPIENREFATGAENVANLPSRLGYEVGPPFGGGEYYFKYGCQDTTEFNIALEKFGAIRVPRMARQSLISLDGQTTRILDDKALLLVVHDWQKDDSNKNRRLNPAKDKKRVDWTFTVLVPWRFHYLFNNPKGYVDSDHPNFRQPVPSPRIDVYVGGESPIVWEEVKVPANVQVLDKRAEAAPVNLEEGGVIKGGVFDTATHQIIAGAEVVLVKRAESRSWDEAARTKTDDTGRFEIQNIPQGYYKIHIRANGYADRDAGAFRNHRGYMYDDMDILLAKEVSCKGIVKDERGNAISGVKVIAREMIGIDGLGYKCPSEISATTDEEGRFELLSIPEGFMHIRCRAPSLHQQTSIFDMYKVSAKPWEKPENIEMVMTGTGSVRGKVVGSDGKPPARQFMAEIEPKGGNKVGSWGGSMQCKPDGSFEFKGVPPGEYIVFAQPNPMHEGESSPPQSVTIAPGKTIDLEITNDFAHTRKR